jgi:transposase
MPRQYPKEFRERAVRLVTESLDEHDTQWATIAQVATRLGVGPGVA